MENLILSNWVTPDLRANKSYVSSYGVRTDAEPIFQIDLNKQLGFFQISEFVSPHGEQHFIMEQTNKVGKPKIAVFDKDSGSMLGVLRGKTLLNQSDEPVFQIFKVAELPDPSIAPKEAQEDDLIALHHNNRAIAALFYFLPRPGSVTLAKKIRSWLKGGAQEVMKVNILEPDLCDRRMYCAIAVVLHNRRGVLGL